MENLVSNVGIVAAAYVGMRTWLFARDAKRATS